MGLLSGLEKFGFSLDGDLDILADEKKEAKEEVKASAAPKVEKDYIIDKKGKCPICDKPFLYRGVATTRLKRLDPDFDLKPNFEAIDVTKYDVISCPSCGYTALSNTFDKIDSARMKLVRNGFCPNYKPQFEDLPEIYSYDYAAEKMKLSLVCTMMKKGKLSEKSYTCLKLAWLRRAQIAELESAEEKDQKLIDELKEEYEGFYKQAYDGFLKCLTSETPPYCGLPSETLEYMLCHMGVYFKDYDNASKLIARRIQSPNTKSKMKDKLVELKEEIANAKE